MAPMNVNDLLNVVSGISSDVSRAIDSGDFSGLGDRTKERINYAKLQMTPPDQTSGLAGMSRSRANASLTSYQYNQPPNLSLFRRDRGRSGILQIVAGTVGAVFSGIGALSFFGGAASSSAAGGILGGIMGGFLTGGGLVLGAVFLMSLGLIHSGVKSKKLLQKYYEYGAAIGNAEFMRIDRIAALTGSTTKEVTKNLTAMIRKNMLPGARFDRQKTTIILTESAYEQYKAAEQGRIEREAKQQMRGELPVNTASSNLDGDVQKIIDDGNRAIVQVRAINDEIPDTRVMSDKLYRLEEIMKRIFEQVRKDPSSAADLRKFMDYYLPTTTKLLTAYVELDRQTVQGENIVKTKEEIESSLDTINDAFEQLLDSMFSDMAMDISTDISVMKTMMAQDGLSQTSGMGMQ
ncbi:MAG: 5-bromo-4-chloroindolyl phosphate hydrolysis family protein [Lachnospiraceae bacterium]|nr:5-bromo-4-chloroindolyl phosphate hydrolysis family protein [Lachnospiraceae bacterium]